MLSLPRPRALVQAIDADALAALGVELDEEGLSDAGCEGWGATLSLRVWCCWSVGPVRSLCVVLLAACLIGLAGARPAIADDESPTPGLWINPELGMRGPMASQGNDRSRASITRDLCERIRKQIGGSYNYPGPSIACLVYKHVMALRPYEGELETEAAFLATQYTVARLSPVLFENFSQTTAYSAMMKELQDTPSDHLKVLGPRFAEETFLEDQPWDRDMPPDDWAVWAEAPEERVAGLRFAPRIRFETYDERYAIEVWGVGLWPETGDLVMVVTYTFGYGPLSEHALPFQWWGPGGQVAVLCHDPRLAHPGGGRSLPGQ